MDSGFGYHAETIQRHIEIVPGYEPLRASLLPDIDVGPSTLQQVLEAAADFAERVEILRAKDFVPPAIHLKIQSDFGP